MGAFLMRSFDLYSVRVPLTAESGKALLNSTTNSLLHFFKSQLRIGKGFKVGSRDHTVAEGTYA